MNEPTHLSHGLAGDNTPPDWPALTVSEVEALLRDYPAVGAVKRVAWHSPRPLSAACLVETAHGAFFVKRHHRRVRNIETLGEEHRFIAHLRRRGMPIPRVLADADGNAAIARGDWVYEVHQCAEGVDLYRESVSWEPLRNRAHALAAGHMLARLHDAAADYHASQRATHVLVARSELICAADPVAALLAQLPQRAGLASFLRERPWQDELTHLLAPWHAAAQPQLARQTPLWTHGDWHVSNLYWRDDTAGAQISGVLDFGLCARNFALFDLATAIERNAIAWLALGGDADIAHPTIARALIEGYRQQRPLSTPQLHLLADLLPLVHVDFALSEVEYYHAITGSQANAEVAYDTFLRGHAAWFHTHHGQALLQAIRHPA
ncbi:phosphotransferase [Rhodanobacter ginsengiterrae]|uniref:phosphotransferase n=1 Tax=Rhodanobacter ginsengiterrae TaxID=2008451 RepID=UPI003CF0E926